MDQYKIVTDATCDMNQDILEKYDIDVIPMVVTMDDGRQFLHYPDFRNFAVDEFYKELEKGNLAHTSQISPAEYESFFTPYLEKGVDLLYVCFSSGLSSTYDNAVAEAAKLLEKYPGRRLRVVDSLCACGGEGVLAVRAGLNKEAGMSLEENAEWLENNRLRLAHYFTVSDLFYLHKGGRVSKTAAVVGTALQVKPMLYVDDLGKLVVYGPVRGQRRSYQKLLEYTQKSIQHPEEQILYISTSMMVEESRQLREQILKTIPCQDVIITRVGPVVGTHTGPTIVCLFSFGSGRVPQK